MFDHKKFSKDLKLLKYQYRTTGTSNEALMGLHLQALEQVDLSRLETDSDKIAFWINVYNGLTNYWVIKKKIQKSMLEQPLLVLLAKVTIGGYRFSLDDIEHGILRKNRRSLYKLCKQFSKKDSRRQFMVNEVDYRIHFALNCGAKSCPAVSFYESSKLEQQLQIAETNFVSQEFLVNHSLQTIHCSKIFWLYKKDFVDVYINAPQYQGYKIRYRKYDFSIS